jgi:hypothetical protein
VAGSPSKPLSTEQAKERLRSAVEGLRPEPWVRSHPWEAMLVGVVAGFLVGALPPQGRGPVVRQLFRVFPGVSEERRHRDGERR